ncbi:MAG: ribonuclease P protein component [Patescibacteria group bacterium]|nr:ribonuclease P protein component [Patescibacteria group bacterium]
MLPKEFRLSLEKNFRRIKKYARPLNTPYFTVLINRPPHSPGTSPNQTKIGFVVSTKVGKSTVRNRAKRLLSESVRLNLDKIPSGLELVFIIRSSAVEVGLEKIQPEVEKVLERIKSV